MKKTKWIPAVAVVTVLFAIANPNSSSDQAAKTPPSQTVQETVESSESEIARSFESIEISSESPESEPAASSDSATESSSNEDEIPNTAIETTASEPEAPAEISEPVVEKTAPAEPEQVSESVSEVSVSGTVPSEEPATAPESEVIAQPASESESTSNTDNRGGNDENFNKYYNPEQQNTEELVLNTSTMKIHHSHCSSVAKIKPENYATTTLSVAELEAQGYVKCKQKGDW